MSTIAITHDAPEKKMTRLPNSQFHAELIPEDQQPMQCEARNHCKCPDVARFWITADSGYDRTPLCLADANFVFAEWMVGI